MNFISKIIKAVPIAMKLANSWEYLSKGEVDRADKEIDKLFKIYRNPLPDDLAFAGYVRYRAKRFHDAVVLYERSLISIEGSTKINQDTKNYLKVYIRKPMAFSLAFSQKRSDLFDELAEAEMTINLENVSDRIKTIHRVNNLGMDKSIKLINF